MLVHMALQEHGVLLGVETAGDVLRKLRERTAAKLRRILTHGQRVQVGHKVIAVKFIGKRTPVLHRAQVVAQMQIARGLDAGKHYFLCRIFHFNYRLSGNCTMLIWYCIILLLT